MSSTISEKLDTIYRIKGEMKTAIEVSGNVWDDTKSTDAGMDLSTYPAKINRIAESSRPSHKITYTFDVGIDKTLSPSIVIDGGSAHVKASGAEYYNITSAKYCIGGNDPIVIQISNNAIDVVVDNVTSDIEIIAETSYYGPIPCVSVVMEDDSCSIGTNDVWEIRYSLIPSDTTDMVRFESSDATIASVDRDGRITWVGPGTTSVKVICGEAYGTISVECEVPKKDCESIDFTINGVDDEIICVDDLESNVITLNALVEPSDVDFPVTWSISNKLLEGDYEDLRYHQYGTSYDGTTRVPYYNYNATTGEYVGGESYAWNYDVNDDVSLSYPKFVSGDDIVMYKDFSYTGKTASFSLNFDGRCVVTARCGSKSVSKTLAFYVRDLGGKKFITGKYRPDPTSTSSVGTYQAVSQAIPMTQTTNINPTLIPYRTGDVIEVVNENYGNANTNVSHALIFWSSSVSSAGFSGYKISDLNDKEKLAYNGITQIYPLYKHFDVGFEPAYKYSKYQSILSDDGTNMTWYKVWRTNTLLEDGTPDYGEGSDIIKSIDAIPTYCGYNQYRLIGGRMIDDYLTITFASGNRASAKIDGKTENCYSTAFINHLKQGITVKQNGVVIFGGDSTKVGMLCRTEGCSLSYAPESVDKGSSVSTTVTPDEQNAELRECVVTIDGIDITSKVFDSATNTINIPKAVGTIRIDISYSVTINSIYARSTESSGIQIDGNDVTMKNSLDITSENDTKNAWIESLSNN